MDQCQLDIDVKVSDWYLIDVNLRIFDVWDVALYGFA